MTAEAHPYVDPNDSALARKAYAELAAERALVSDERLQHLTVDIDRIAPVVFNSFTQVQPYFEGLGKLPDLNVAIIEDIPRRMRALLRADELFLQATGDVERVKELLSEGLPLREEMLRWAPTLVAWNIFKDAEVKGWREGKGHADAGTDLVAMSGAYVTNWKQIEGKVNFTLAEALRAGEVGEDLLQAIGAKGSRQEVKAATRDRQAAFTLLVEAWDELTRGIVYLRWHHGDAGELVPSLFAAGRRPAKKKTETAAAEG